MQYQFPCHSHALFCTYQLLEPILCLFLKSTVVEENLSSVYWLNCNSLTISNKWALSAAKEAFHVSPGLFVSISSSLLTPAAFAPSSLQLMISLLGNEAITNGISSPQVKTMHPLFQSIVMDEESVLFFKKQPPLLEHKMISSLTRL